MKAVEVTRFGGPEVLELVDRPRPVPGDGQILIEVKAAGINFADIMNREGRYRAGGTPPFILGMEAAGTIAEVGPGVANLTPGPRVTAMVNGGGYAEYAVADAAQVVPIPDSIDFPAATALLVQGLTAYWLLKGAGEMKPGKTVLITAAAGGVGSLLVQIAKFLGAGTVIGLASSEEKRELVKSLGADYAVDYTQPGWGQTVRELTGGKGVDLYFDATGDTQGEGPTTLAQGGFWVIFGSQKSDSPGLTAAQIGGLVGGANTIRGFSLYNVFPDVAAISQGLRDLVDWTAGGKLRIETSNRYPLSEARRAQDDIVNRRTTGKVVLEP